MRRKRGQSNAKEREKAPTSLSCRGKIISTIRNVCERDKGDLLMPGYIYSKKVILF